MLVKPQKTVNLAKQIPVSTKPFKEYLDKSLSESFRFITVRPVTDEIEREITKINPNKSYGFDNLHPKVVRKVAHLIKYPLKIIYNKSLSSGIIPEKLKVSLITPVYKNEDETSFSNYRPIAVLPCFSKLLEKLMYKRLINFIRISKESFN